jgi:hypothetical protein
MQLSQQEITMFKHATNDTAPAVLTEEQLEFVSGGVHPDATGNIPTCPALPPIHGGAVSGTPRWPEFPGSPPM